MDELEHGAFFRPASDGAPRVRFLPYALVGANLLAMVVPTVQGIVGSVLMVVISIGSDAPELARTLLDAVIVLLFHTPPLLASVTGIAAAWTIARGGRTSIVYIGLLGTVLAGILQGLLVISVCIVGFGMTALLVPVGALSLLASGAVAAWGFTEVRALRTDAPPA